MRSRPGYSSMFALDVCCAVPSHRTPLPLTPPPSPTLTSTCNAIPHGLPVRPRFNITTSGWTGGSSYSPALLSRPMCSGDTARTPLRPFSPSLVLGSVLLPLTAAGSSGTVNVTVFARNEDGCEAMAAPVTVQLQAPSLPSLNAAYGTTTTAGGWCPWGPLHWPPAPFTLMPLCRTTGDECSLLRAVVEREGRRYCASAACHSAPSPVLMSAP